MEKQVSRRDVLESVGRGGTISAAVAVAGCIEQSSGVDTTRGTSAGTPTTESDASQPSDSSQTDSLRKSSTPTDQPTPCAGVFDSGPTPDETPTPECVDTDLTVNVYGRPKTPTPTDSTSTPYEFEKVIVVEVELSGEGSRSLEGCIEVDCPTTDFQPVSISLPESKTTQTYEFGPFGYHCLGRISFWIDGCLRNGA